jgi:hypothetical protein
VETVDGTKVKHVAVDSKKDGNRHSRSNETWALIIVDVLTLLFSTCYLLSWQIAKL